MTLYCKQLTHYTQPSTIPLPSRLSSVPPPSPHRGWPGPADPHCKILTMLIPDDSSRVPDTDTSFFSLSLDAEVARLRPFGSDGTKKHPPLSTPQHAQPVSRRPNPSALHRFSRRPPFHKPCRPILSARHDAWDVSAATNKPASLDSPVEMISPFTVSTTYSLRLPRTVAFCPESHYAIEAEDANRGWNHERVPLCSTCLLSCSSPQLGNLRICSYLTAKVNASNYLDHTAWASDMRPGEGVLLVQ